MGVIGLPFDKRLSLAGNVLSIGGVPPSLEPILSLEPLLSLVEACIAAILKSVPDFLKSLFEELCCIGTCGPSVEGLLLKLGKSDDTNGSDDTNPPNNDGDDVGSLGEAVLEASGDCSPTSDRGDPGDETFLGDCDGEGLVLTKSIDDILSLVFLPEFTSLCLRKSSICSLYNTGSNSASNCVYFELLSE